MNIAVMGAGYVGLVTAACFAELGNHVTCVDINKEKIANLNRHILPIYEPGLEELIQSNKEQNRLQFVCSLSECEQHPQVIFIAVGTPSDEQGSADIQYVLSAAQQIGAYLQHDCVIVDKSTVPVGMAEKVKEAIYKECEKQNKNMVIEVVSNPEFLREGAAIQDFVQPDRLIIGVSSESAKNIMLDLYLPLLRNPERIYFMQVKDAELTKYAANAMLATRISFMNEMALICQRMGVDIENVRIGIGSDSRIGSAFLNPGCGYGGSCFPKDVKALIKMAEREGIEPLILHAVEQRNYQQKRVLPEQIIQKFGNDLSHIQLAVWGLSFKPGTDDMREASSLILLEYLLAHGATIYAYDPAAMQVAKEMVARKWLDAEKLIFVDQQYDAVHNADALALVTEWKPFCYPDLQLMKEKMRQPIVFDGRNQYDPHHLRAAGFEYYGIGRG